MRYSSKKETILIVAFVILLFIPIKTLIAGDIDKAFNLSVIGVYFFLLLIAFTIQYKIKDSVLIVSTLFIPTHKIKVEEIQSIKNVKSLISAPAGSVYRIKIAYGSNKNIMISPSKEKEFLNQLTHINPKIQIL